MFLFHAKKSDKITVLQGSECSSVIIFSVWALYIKEDMWGRMGTIPTYKMEVNGELYQMVIVCM